MSIFKVMRGTHLVDDEHLTLENAERACRRIRANAKAGESIVIHWFDTKNGQVGHFLVGTFFFVGDDDYASRFVRFS